jgi:hypothetical protein
MGASPKPISRMSPMSPIRATPTKPIEDEDDDEDDFEGHSYILSSVICHLSFIPPAAYHRRDF